MSTRTFAAAVFALTLLAVVRVASTHRVFSETIDEPVHVAAGYQWTTERYRMDMHSPPLGRILSGVALRVAGVPPPPPGDQVDRGNALFYYGNRYEKNLARARMGTLVWLIVAIVTLALWARRAFSPGIAILAVAIFTNLPPVLGHAGLATNDVALVAMLTLALYSFDRFLEVRTMRRAVLLGVAIGAGAITKFSFIAFFPPCALILAAMRCKRDRAWPWREALVVLACAFVTIWAGYQFEVARPATIHPEAVFVWEYAAPKPLQRLARWVAVNVPIPAPGFPTGMAMVKLHDQGGHAAFLLGKHSDTGWWYYFPVVFFFKTPIPFLLLMAWGIALAVRARKRLELVLMPLAMFVAVMPASLNIGLRYLLPVYVFLSIVAAYGASEIWRRARDSFSRAALAGALAWMFIGAAAAHPDYVACFSELAPVPSRIAVDSNLDWGQDTLRLAREVKARKIDFLWTVYSTNADMERHGIRFRTLDPGKRTPGWIAVGETPIRLSERYGGYEWMSLYKPVAQVGKTIRLYRIPAEY